MLFKKPKLLFIFQFILSMHTLNRTVGSPPIPRAPRRLAERRRARSHGRRLPELLRRVSPRRICELRAAAASYYRAFMWEADGLAYDMLLLSLCRRALALHSRLRAHTGSPTWGACAQISAQTLLHVPLRAV